MMKRTFGFNLAVDSERCRHILLAMGEPLKSSWTSPDQAELRGVIGQRKEGDELHGGTAP
jgi:hypothetical protein